MKKRKFKQRFTFILLCCTLIAGISLPSNNTYAKHSHGKGYIATPQLSSATSVYTSNYRKTRTSFPSQYDLRSNGYLTSVRDQGDYGLCWAFATNTCMESNALKNGLGTYDLSEVYMGYFGLNGVSNPLPGLEDDLTTFDSELKWYDLGGNGSIATLFLANGYGPVSESDAPYSILPNNPPENLATGHNALSIAKIYEIPGTDRSSMKDAILENGAITLGICSDFENDTYFNTQTNALYVDHNAVLDHEITVIGWDDNYSRNNFGYSKPTHDGAWLCQNSWGTNWGDNGLFWLSYEDKTAKYDTCYSYEVAPKNIYRKIYQHDGCYGSFYYEDTIRAANVFTATGSEEITALGNYMSASSGVVSIYTNVTNNNPESGTKLSSTPFSVLRTGYYTIPLKEPVHIKKGQRYSVVFRYNKGCVSYIDANDSNFDESILYEVSVEPGQSYICFSGGSWWGPSDFNCRIKALTGHATTLFATNTGSGKVELNWADVDSVSSYELYRKTSDGNYTLLSTLPADTTTYTDKGLKIGSLISYKLIPKSTTSDTTEFQQQVKTILAAPSNLRLSKTSSGISVKWKRTERATKYIIYRKVKGGNYKQIKTVTTTSFKDTTVKKGKIYFYYIKAVSSNQTKSANSSAKHIKF